jgi:Flp pilus assembly protein TadG
VTRPDRRDRGQAAVEFALAVPIVVVLVLGVVQVLVVGVRQAAVERLARDGARAASVSAQPHGAARTAVERATGLRPIDVQVSSDRTTVTVTVSYTDPTVVPIVGRAIGDVHLTAEVTMPREPP